MYPCLHVVIYLIFVGLEEKQESAPIATPTLPSKDSAGKPRDQRMRELVLQALSTIFSDFEGMFEEQQVGEEQEEAGKEQRKALKKTGGQKPATTPNSPSSAQTNSRTPSSISSRFRTGDGVVPSDKNSNKAVGTVKIAAIREGGDVKDGGQGNEAGNKGAHESGAVAAHVEGEGTMENSEDAQKSQEGGYV